MHKVLTESWELDIPQWVNNQETFRQWAHSETFPETGNIWWLQGGVWADMSQEQLFTHSRVKTHVTSVGSSSITDDLSLRINVGSNAAVPNQANSFPSLNIPSGYYYLGTKVTSPEASAIVEPQGGCQRRCQDPHPGQFQTWNGQQNGCWIQVWRKWPDGCQHYQWYNSCNGYWDAYPNGAPKVFWTCCIHQ